VFKGISAVHVHHDIFNDMGFALQPRILVLPGNMAGMGDALHISTFSKFTEGLKIENIPLLGANQGRRDHMALWQRLLIILVAIVAASIIAGLIWNALFSITLPSYIGGVIGGLTAVPVWEFLKRVGPKPK
jgi:hypothetical protein